MTGTGWATLNTGDIVEAVHVSKVYGHLSGTSGQGEQTILTDFASASLYALKIKNTGSGGKALQIRNAADTANLLLVEDSGLVFLGSPIRPEAYGAAADGTTDDATAIQAALDAVKALGGGDVELDPRKSYRSASRLTVGQNTKLRHGGIKAHNNASLRNTLLMGTSSVAFSMPAIVLGGDGSSAGAGDSATLEDITVEMLGTATAATYQGGTVSAVICVDRMGGSSGAAGTRAFVRRVKVTNAIDFVQVGTITDPYGAGQIVMEECRGNITGDVLVIKGVDYLYFRNNDMEGPGGSTKAVIRIDGASANMPDGGSIDGNFCEDFPYGVFINPTGGSVANLHIGPHNTFDGTTVYGIYLHPATSGGTNGLIIEGNEVNGTGASGSIGILLDQDNNTDILSTTIRDNRVTSFGQHGIAILTPTAAADIRNTLIQGNRILGCSAQTPSTYSGIYIGSGVEEVDVLYNEITRIAGGNVVKYGVEVTGTNAKVYVIGNVAPDAGTSVVLKGTTPAATVVYQGNVGPTEAGDAPSGQLIPVGPFHYTNPNASLASTDMPLPSTDSNVRFISPVKGRVYAISLSCQGAAIASAANRTATATVSVNGSAGTLATTFTPDGALFGSRNSQASGDTFAAGDYLGVKLATGAGWTATDDVTVWIWILPT